MKKEEANDIIQSLMPNLAKVSITVNQCKIDTSTDQSGRMRGDVWISRKTQPSKDFEKNILALIEAKHRNCEIGDIHWRDAMAKGKAKAEKQGLTFYIVSNCINAHRFYNRYTDDEIILDDKPITRLQPLEVLQKIQAQVGLENSSVLHKLISTIAPASETKFRKSLKSLANIYRSCGLKKGDKSIDPTVAFVILKYIGEKENDQRTLNHIVNIWNQYGKGSGNYRADFKQSCKDIFGGDYGKAYKDFKELIDFPKELNN